MPTNTYQPIMWVNSEAEARNLYISNGTTVLLMDRNVQRFYMKSTDLIGNTTSFRIFEFQEVIPQVEAAPESASYVTTEDFNKAIEELKELIVKKPSRTTVKG